MTEKSEYQSRGIRFVSSDAVPGLMGFVELDKAPGAGHGTPVALVDSSGWFKFDLDVLNIKMHLKNTPNNDALSFLKLMREKKRKAPILSIGGKEE